MNEMKNLLDLVNSFEHGGDYFRGVSNLEFYSEGEPVAIVRYNHEEQLWEAVEV